MTQAKGRGWDWRFCYIVVIPIRVQLWRAKANHKKAIFQSYSQVIGYGMPIQWKTRFWFRPGSLLFNTILFTKNFFKATTIQFSSSFGLYKMLDNLDLQTCFDVVPNVPGPPSNSTADGATTLWISSFSGDRFKKMFLKVFVCRF